jgi:hypothetical protein
MPPPRRTHAPWPVVTTGCLFALVALGCGNGVRRNPLATLAVDARCSNTTCGTEREPDAATKSALDAGSDSGPRIPERQADAGRDLSEADGGELATDAEEGCIGECGSLKDGAPCRQDRDCSSGMCTDGTCCIQKCTACQACTGAGGTCRALFAGQLDDNPPGACGGDRVCDGHGWCKLQNGKTCAEDDACLSKACQGNVCCGSPCSGCDSCTLPGHRGVCMAVGNGESPDGCTGFCSEGQCASMPSIGLLPTRWDFLEVPIGQSVHKVFSLASIWEWKVLLAVSGPQAGAFTVRFSQCPGEKVVPGWTCTIDVTFSPRSLGLATGRLEVLMAPPSSPELLTSVPLLGKGQ